MRKIFIISIFTIALLFAADNNVQYNGTFHGSANNSPSNTFVFNESYHFLESTDGGIIYDDEIIYIASSAYKDDLTGMKVRLWIGSEVLIDGSFIKNQNWFNWMSSGYTADYGIWRAEVNAGTGGLDFVGTVYYRIQHIDGSDIDYLVASGVDYTNPYGQVMDDDGLATDYSFTIVDDDLNGPSFSNATLVNNKLRIDIVDDSGIYDPGSGSDRIFLRYDDDGEVDANFDGTLDLSPLSGNTFETDLTFPYGDNRNVTYRVYAYDDDIDRTNDRMLNTFENTQALPVELTSFTALTQNEAVKVTWETATEVNNYGFEIERTITNSKFQIPNWENVGFVEGHGNSNSAKQYSYVDNSVRAGQTYSYRLKQIDFDGQFEYSNVVNVEVGVPMEFSLAQNYPNPFNPSTSIEYSVPSNEFVTLKVYDVLGNTVSTLVNETKEAGKYNVSFDASNLTSGIYFYSINAGGFTQVKKMMLVK